MTRGGFATIFGTGRSGSTWLGSIVDTHPDLAYRFEPLARLRDDTRVLRLCERIMGSGADLSLLDDLHQCLLRADPLTCKPPFFPKRHQRTLGRAWMWPASRAANAVRDLFSLAYAARPGTPLVFKEVGLNRLVIPLVRDAGLRAIYLIRHPCGVVSSTLEGQQKRLMPAGRREVVADLLRKHDQALWARWATDLPSASPATIEALLWRIEVEEALREVWHLPHVHLVVYEDLCARTEEVAGRAFEHLGLNPSEQTRRLLEAMSSPNSAARRAHGDRWVNDYFSVFRDPRDSAEKWKKQLPKESVTEIFGAVESSPAFTRCAAIGNWT